MTDPRAILDTPVPPGNASGAATIRDYLTRLLSELWRMGSCFDSKQPFGDTAWEGDLHTALAQAGHINSAIEDGSSLSDEEAGYTLIAAAIQALGAPPDEDDRHVLQISANGWAIQHPLACRPDLLSCPVHQAAGKAREPMEQLSQRLNRQLGHGRYVCGVHDDARFYVGERIEETARG